MTDLATNRSSKHPGRRTARHLGSVICAVLFFVTFTLGVTSVWTRMTVFDSARFAERADQILDSDVVRAKLADEFTTAIVNSGPSNLASFRTIIRTALDPIMQTPTFRAIFRRSLDTSHDYLFTRNGNAAVVNLSEGLSVLAGSLQATNPDLANAIPSGTTEVLVKIGNQTQGLGLWRIARDLTIGGVGLLIASGVFLLGSILIDSNRRRGGFALGIAIIFSGIVMFLTAVVVPIIAGSYANDPETQRAFTTAADLFISDYRSLAVWFVGIGVLTCAFVTASTPNGEPPTIRSTIDRMGAALQRRMPTTQRGRTTHAVLLIILGVLIVLQRQTVVPVAVVAIGALIAYVGAVQLLTIVGRPTDVPTRTAVVSELKNFSFRSPAIRVTLASLVVLVTIIFGAWYTTSEARAKSIQNEERKCNGSANLCDKPLNEVAFLGSHNSMSTASDPGWLFYEQNKSIPAQLDYGVRALMVKTHYGIPTTVNVTGANLVITDSLAELTVNPIEKDDQYSNEEQKRAKQLQATVKVDPSLRDVYLCHVYCEYGATKFSTALGYTRQFLVNNPNNVIMWFIGDYVSKSDTEKILGEAKLLDRVWFYDPNAPIPTLGQLIDSNRNLIMISEFSGAPPDWNVRGYGIFQDTPFTFRKDADLFAPGSSKYTGTETVTGPVPATAPGLDGTEQWTPAWTGLPSCAPNRGTPSSPLFQINHWITPAGSAPTVDQARIVNGYDVLMPRVQDCMTQRSKFPTIIGVNFVEIGDARRVVDELNSTNWTPAPAQ